MNKLTGQALIAFIILLITSCSDNEKVAEKQELVIQDTAVSKQNFFPVTNYIKGQISEIKNAGINPIKYTTISNKTDSVWLKIEDLEKELQEFTEPVIDTANMKPLFEEKGFLDQTINAFTFSYDPKKELPETIKLMRWDVYIDPVTNKVKRVYLIKNPAPDKTLQLTWQSDKWCKIVHLAVDKNNNSFVEKEVLINWDL